MLKVEGLNAGYGSVNILWDVGFEVKDGELVAILGSNGAGTTITDSTGNKTEVTAGGITITPKPPGPGKT